MGFLWGEGWAGKKTMLGRVAEPGLKLWSPGPKMGLVLGYLLTCHSGVGEPKMPTSSICQEYSAVAGRYCGSLTVSVYTMLN